MANLIDYRDVMKFLEINMSKYAEKSDGTSTSTGTKKLIDSAADFVTDVIKVNMIVYNLTLSTFTYVTGVDDLNNLSLNDDIFTATDQEYYIFNYEDMTVVNMNYHVNFAIEETFDRLRVRFDSPETLLINETTVKGIAIWLACHRIATKLYKFFQIPLDEAKEWEQNALNKIEDIIDGKIVFDLATDSVDCNIQSGLLTGGAILKTTDFDGDYTQAEIWKPEIEINEKQNNLS